MTAARKMYLTPDSVVDKIVTRYGYEKLGEFSFLLSQYSRYWDEHETGEGFDLSHYSEISVIYFDMVRPEVDEKHRQFFAQSAQMAKAAEVRWTKEIQKENLRARKRQWYVDNSDRVNQNKRKKRLATRLAASSHVSSHVSSHGAQGKENLSVAKNDAYAYRNYEIMNKRNHKKIHDMGAVDNLCGHNPLSGLTGHNLPERQVVKTIRPLNAEHKEHEERLSAEAQNAERRSVSITPLSPAGSSPPGEPELGKMSVQPAAPRTTIYADKWIRIGDDFKVDLFDPMFADFSRATKFLINGFEMWCRKRLIGERHDKWWLRDQLGRNFANRQGRVSYMGEKNG